jgi:branched-chain amino acid transport system permease protein
MSVKEARPPTGPTPKGLARYLRVPPPPRTSFGNSMRRRWSGLSRPAKVVLIIAGLAAAYLLPYVTGVPILGWILDTPGTDFSGVLADQVVILVIVALGLNVVVGWAGLLDLGYVGFYAVGAYTVAVLGSAHGSLPWLACVPIAIVISMLSGVALGTPTLRLRGDYLAIVTLGFGELIRTVANNSLWLNQARGISNIPGPPSIGPLKFGVLDAKPYYWLGLTVIILLVFLLRRLQDSRVGRAWTAIREDEDAAELMGVPTFKFKLWAFAIGAAIGGLAGTLYAGKVGFINPDNFPLTLSILFLAAVVLGGTGNIPGAILGGVLIAYLPERFRNFQDKRVFVFGIALILVMVFRPQGLWPSRQQASEMAHPSSAPDMPGLAGADLTEGVDPDPGVEIDG